MCGNTELQKYTFCRSQGPRCIRYVSAAARLLRLWVRILAESWMSVVSAECCHPPSVVCPMSVMAKRRKKTITFNYKK